MANLQTVLTEIDKAKQFAADAAYGTSIMAVSAIKTEDYLLDIRNALVAALDLDGGAEAVKRIDTYLPLIHGSNSVHATELEGELDKLLMDVQGADAFGILDEVPQAV